MAKPKLKGWRASGDDDHGNRATVKSTSGVFDELVVGDWLHLEAMNTFKNGHGHWWMRLGDYMLNINVDKSGNLTVYQEYDGGPNRTTQWVDHDKVSK